MTKKDLSLICNYSEKNIDSSYALFNYLSFEYSEDIKLIQKKNKQK